ncbi:MAG: hypothetical protein HZA14_05710 [Nitrospirae bacterium]|nr:hypothetical protein [Nitrospirota bacterium]
MKSANEGLTKSDENNSKRLKGFIEKQTRKLKLRQFTCPFCKEILYGLSNYGTHLKKHCT